MDDIVTDKALVVVVGDLVHYMKPSPRSPMREDFCRRLHDFILNWRLDGDPHSFAAMPDGYVEGQCRDDDCADEFPPCIGCGGPCEPKALDWTFTPGGHVHLRCRRVVAYARFAAFVRDMTAPHDDDDDASRLVALLSIRSQLNVLDRELMPLACLAPYPRRT